LTERLRTDGGVDKHIEQAKLGTHILAEAKKIHTVFHA
jgi:hypothetical protein